MFEEVVARRDVVAAAALTALLGLKALPAEAEAEAAAAAAPRKLFANTELAGNDIASGFDVVEPGVETPRTTLWSTNGKGRLANLSQSATLVSLWAEWCVPCLSEMHDLAELGTRHRASGFDVVAVMQGSRLDVPAARAKLNGMNAATLPNWVEPNGAATIADALATPKGAKGFTLPCNLLVDRHGRIRGRAFGSHILSGVEIKDGEITDAGKKSMLHAKTAWSLPAADQFARVLAGGLLDRI